MKEKFMLEIPKELEQWINNEQSKVNMYPQLVCVVQNKCSNYLLSPVCDICVRNQNLNPRTDNFRHKYETTITITSTRG
jgi:hypothetical protein